MSPAEAAQVIADQLRPVWGEDHRSEAPKAITLPRGTWAAVVAALAASQHPTTLEPDR